MDLSPWVPPALPGPGVMWESLAAGDSGCREVAMRLRRRSSGAHGAHRGGQTHVWALLALSLSSGADAPLARR